LQFFAKRTLPSQAQMLDVRVKLALQAPWQQAQWPPHLAEIFIK